jgi:predicted GTPase
MSRWRIVLVGLLIAAPFAALAGFGSYFLWSHNLWLVVGWPLTLLVVAGYVLGWYWQRKNRLLKPVDFTPPLRWTDRDREAWKLVQAHAEAAVRGDPDRFQGVAFYAETAQKLALELARFYHPGAADPVGALTVPELLAVVELVARDLAEMVDEYLPGGHLLTVRDWLRARQVAEWYQTANRIYWLVSALFSPVNTGLRYLTTQAGMTRPFQLLQQNLLAWFVTAYVHRLGTYLIDLNSGRLRVGARRFRELQHVWEGQPDGEPPATIPETAVPADGAEAVPRLGLTVAGQVKAGKSSLINALLGERRAITDVLPATDRVSRYELQPTGVPTRLVLFDTVGYAHEGPREDQREGTKEAARQSELILLVCHARNPARRADAELLRQLRDGFAAQPQLRMPPVLGVMTHIDLLSPAMEWAPPYDWVEPRRPKERAIREAWSAMREQLGEYLVGIVPVCTAPGKVYGVEEWLLPTLAQLLDDVRAVALLRCLHAEANVGKVRRVFRQLLATGKSAARILLWDGQSG